MRVRFLKVMVGLFEGPWGKESVRAMPGEEADLPDEFAEWLVGYFPDRVEKLEAENKEQGPDEEPAPKSPSRRRRKRAKK